MIAIRCSALLFDMDGVLIDSTPAVARVWHRSAVEHGLDPDTVVRMAHGRPSRITIRELIPDADVDFEDREVERREMQDLDGVVLLPGARGLLERLASGTLDDCDVVHTAISRGALAGCGIAHPRKHDYVERCEDR